MIQDTLLRHCGNCRHQETDLAKGPCVGCHWFSKWAAGYDVSK